MSTHGTSAYGISGRVAAVVLALVALVALVARFDALRDRLGASRLVAVVEGLTTHTARSGRLPGRLLETNLLRLRRAQELDPHDVTVPIARGGQYLLLGRPRAAERAYLEALEIEERAEIWANLVRVYEAVDDAEAADRAARRAIALDARMRRKLKHALRPRPRRPAAPPHRARADPAATVFIDSFESGATDAWSDGPPSATEAPRR